MMPYKTTTTMREKKNTQNPKLRKANKCKTKTINKRK